MMPRVMLMSMPALPSVPSGDAKPFCMSITSNPVSCGSISKSRVPMSAPSIRYARQGTEPGLARRAVQHIGRVDLQRPLGGNVLAAQLGTNPQRISAQDAFDPRQHHAAFGAARADQCVSLGYRIQ